MAMEVGKVCMKVDGREYGRYCVVIKAPGKEKEKRSFVTVTGPRLLTGVKRRQSNVAHLMETEYKIEIPEDAADEAVIAAYEKAGLVNKLNLTRPSAGDMKSEAAKQKSKPAPVAKEKKPKAEPKKEAKK
jgi:large subunit ribosomal protein L14e